MAGKKEFCCPTPAVNGQHPRPRPDNKKDVPVTPGLACSNPLFVQVCESTTPPTPITLDGEDCAGATVPVSGLPGQLTHVIQAPGTVFKFKMCDEDRDFELACGKDPATDHQIQTAYRIVNGNFEVIKRWDTVTGAEWTGDPNTLKPCGGSGVESAPLDMCDSGVPFIRWVVKKDGQPTAKFDTETDGITPYTVTDESKVSLGQCAVLCADVAIKCCNGLTIGYAYSPARAALVGATVEFMTCDGSSLQAYVMAASDINNTVPVIQGGVTVGFAAETGCTTPQVDVEHEVMCDNGVEFRRSATYEDGVFVGKRDTTTDGQPYTVSDEANVKFGKCVAETVCTPSISSKTADKFAELLPGTSISVQKNNCCAVEVTTSAGSFILSEDTTGYSTDTFNCPVSVTGVEVLSGTCDLSKIIITTQVKG